MSNHIFVLCVQEPTEVERGRTTIWYWGKGMKKRHEAEHDIASMPKGVIFEVDGQFDIDTATSMAKEYAKRFGYRAMTIQEKTEYQEARNSITDGLKKRVPNAIRFILPPTEELQKRLEDALRNALDEWRTDHDYDALWDNEAER